jgi:hypothetical protein
MTHAARLTFLSCGVASPDVVLQLADVHHHAKPAVELETVQAFCGTWVKVGMKQTTRRLHVSSCIMQ